MRASYSKEELAELNKQAYIKGAADMREQAAKMCMGPQLTCENMVYKLTWVNDRLVTRTELSYHTDLSRKIRALPINGE